LYLYQSRGSVNELLDDINACEDESGQVTSKPINQ